MQMIGLLDCNNFFVSCERLFRPDLRRVPVVVLSSNDGCVVARSQEIKDIGIPMGVPYFQIKDKLTSVGAVCFSSHFALYRDISRRVFEVVRQHMPVVEEYSIDECFFLIDTDNVEAKIRILKQAVEQQVGIPVSLGVAATKTRAKYANGCAKKTTGLKVMTEALWQQEARTILLPELWGVGRGRAKQFTAYGIQTVHDLTSLSERTVQSRFGLEGVRLLAELQGKVALPVKTHRQTPKSVMSSRSFAATTTDISVLKDAVSFHLHHVVADLLEQDLKASSLRVFMYPSRHGDYALKGSSLSVALTVPSADLRYLLKEALQLVDKGFYRDVPYKKVGVYCGTLVEESGLSLSLFDDASTKSDIAAVVASLNARFGKNTAQLGRVAHSVPAWSVRQDLLSPDYTTSFSDLKTVS